MSKVRVHRGYFGTQYLENMDFTFAGGPSMGNQGLFIKVNGVGTIGFPPRNFKIHIDSMNDFEIIKESDTGDRSNSEIGGVKPMIAGSYHSPKSHISSEGMLGHYDAPDSGESDEVITMRMAERFQVLQEMSVAAAKSINRGMVVTGAPGIGKSYEAVLALEAFGARDKVLVENGVISENPILVEKDEEDLTEDDLDDDGNVIEQYKSYKYQLVKCHASASGLYAVLYNSRNEGDVVIFDDCDDVLQDETSLQILKSALDTTSRRIINWSLAYERRDGIPLSFEFKGSVIFITNINFERTVREGRSKITKHLEAIMDRCLYLDLMVESMREKLLRIDYVCQETDMLRKLGCTPCQSKEILQYVHENARKFQRLSLRKVMQVATMYKTGGNWRRMAEITLMKGIR